MSDPINNPDNLTLRDYFMTHAPFTVKDVMEYYEHIRKKDVTYENVILTLISMQSQYADLLLETRNATR